MPNTGTQNTLNGHAVINGLLDEREKTHGDFRRNAAIAQALKSVLRQQQEWRALNDTGRESLDMICSKVGRIMAGDSGFQDHHDDVDGYEALARKYG